jgi:putative transposase
MSRWKRSNTCIYNVSYHIIWTPKYRASILKGKIREKIKQYLFEKAEMINITIEKYEIMPDHIHLFIKCTPKHTVSKIVQHLKGYSSYKLRCEYKKYRKYKALWTRSYYCESIGHISESTIKKYIEDQMKNG